MKFNWAMVIEGSVTLVILYWVFTNPTGFGNVATAGGASLVNATRALWGGGPNPMNQGGASVGRR